MNTSDSDLLTLGMEIGFYMLVLIFVFHALFVGYHWFTYGASRSTSTTALGIYLGGGALLLLGLSFIVTTL